MIWLIGNKGMLGNDVEKLLKERGLTYWASDKEVDIGDYKALEKFGKDKKIKWVVNCAGYTTVDKAEEEIDEAFRINKDGARNIALFSAKRQIRLIHISTDYIFDGDKEDVRGYREDDKANPLSVYGKSKLAGEEEIKKVLNEFFIIRTAWLYGLNGHNFIFTMLGLFQKKEKVEVVDDQRGSPTYANDLAKVILKIIQSGSKKYGIYHFSNEGVTNWCEFARAIYSKAKKLGLISNDKKLEIKAIKTEEYPTAAARPKNSILTDDKIKKEFNLDIRDWKEALDDFLSLLKIEEEKLKGKERR
jgi:dTDP-4-dehydrorhamnose reductase